MNNKGFTLIELIATIALLAIIATISFVSINEVIKNSKIKNCENLINNIKSAAKEYASDNRYNFSNNSDKEIMTTDLVNGNYLAGSIVNPFDNSEKVMANIIIKLKSDYTVDSIVVKNNDNEIINCENEKW